MKYYGFMDHVPANRNYILIVDDEEDITALHQSVVRAVYSGPIVVAASGEEALEHVHKLGDPWVIISDHRMSPGDGVFLFESLRTLGSRGHFILCTATPTYEVRALYAGPVTVIEKPKTSGELSKLLPLLLAQPQDLTHRDESTSKT